MNLYKITRLFGYDFHVEILERRVTKQLIDTVRSKYNYEMWLFGRVYIVISNERAYQKMRQNKV